MPYDLDRISREELYELVWSAPASTLAKQFGCSDVLLGRRCRILQVPRPPRGYWAKKASSKAPKKPKLPKYNKVLEEKYRKGLRSGTAIPLSDRQLTLFHLAIDFLRSQELEFTDPVMARDGIEKIDPQLAADVILTVQRQHGFWIETKATGSTPIKNLQPLSGLVDKLLPIASPYLLVFKSKPSMISYVMPFEVTVRNTETFIRKISQLQKLVIDNQLAFTSIRLPQMDHGASPNPWSSPAADINLCVSTNEVWLRYKSPSKNSEDVESERLLLTDVCPDQLVSSNDKHLVITPNWSLINDLMDRASYLEEQRSVLQEMELVVETCGLGASLSALTRIEKHCFTDNERPFSSAFRALHRVKRYLSQLRREVQEEERHICDDLLGIRINDDVVISSDHKPIRVKVLGLRLEKTETGVNVLLDSRKYKTDGSLFKRSNVEIIELQKNDSFDIIS